MNVDRTARNTNMLSWHNELWLIDHGAALYFHHTWSNWKEQSVKPFAQIKDHVLLPQASLLQLVNEELKKVVTEERIRSIVSIVPDEWLQHEDIKESPDEMRNVYSQFLINRISHTDIFVNEAINAGKFLI